MRDLHYLSKFRERLSYLYIEKCRLERYHNSVAAETEKWRIPIPVCDLALILLGPGTTITHEAMKVLANSNCQIAWSGEHGVRMYAQGLGGTHSSSRLMKQAEMWGDAEKRMEVVKRMYEIRFGESLDENFNLNQVRGKEGNRVRSCYKALAKRYSVEWHGRSYDPKRWNNGDSVNKAISAANACLYGIVHAAIVSLGFSAGLGFIHVGKMLSFVYDIGDIFKTEVSLPIAFQTVSDLGDCGNPGSEVRVRCRDFYKTGKLMSKIVDKTIEVIYGNDDPGEDHGIGPGRIVPVVGRVEGGDIYWEDQCQDTG